MQILPKHTNSIILKITQHDAFDLYSRLIIPTSKWKQKFHWVIKKRNTETSKKITQKSNFFLLKIQNHYKNKKNHIRLVCVCVLDEVKNRTNQPTDKAILRVGCDAKCIFAKSTRLTHVLSFASWQNEGFSFAFDLCKHTLERVVMRWIFSKILFSCSLLCLELAYKYSKYRYKISWLETGLKIPTF